MSRRRLPRAVVLLVLAAGVLVAVPEVARSATTPVDGQWRLSAGARFLSFEVEDDGRRMTDTLVSVGSLIEPCGWTGPFSDAPEVAVRGGRFTADQTGAAQVDPTRVHVEGEFTSPTTATLRFTVRCTRATGPATASYEITAATDAPPPGRCGSARLVDGSLHLGASGAARSHPKRFRGGRGAFAIRRRGPDCAAVSTAMGALLGARDESLALGGAGLVATRVRRGRFRGHPSYTVTVLGLGGSLSYRRIGRPRVDHSVYRAGQRLLFFADDNSSERCTAGFAATVPGLPGPVGLSASHCIRRNPDRLAVRRGPHYADSEPIGHELTPPGARPGGFDAGYLSILFRYGVAQQVERGEQLPLTVTGAAADADTGTAVCFAGTITGADQCGRVTARRLRQRPALRCTDIAGHQGDSGGPVYLDPRGGLRTRAVGLVAVVVGPPIKLGRKDITCFTPIVPALSALGAALPPGPAVRPPQPDGAAGDF